MDATETQKPFPSEDLQQKCAALQQQINILLLALLILGGIVTAYLYAQLRLVSKELDPAKGPATQMIQAFQKEQPGYEGFLKKLVDYSKTHPDFMPIIDKWKLAVNPQAAGTPPSTAPAAKP